MMILVFTLLLNYFQQYYNKIFVNDILGLYHTIG